MTDRRVRTVLPEDPNASVSVGDFAAWAAANGVPLSAGLRTAPLAGGRSNQTLLITDARGRKVVLRRPPAGSSGGLGRQAAREHLVLSALAARGIPVPSPFGIYRDPGQPDSPFLVLGFADGVVLQTETDVAGFDAAARLRVGEELARAAARLHAIDPTAAGLDRISPRSDLTERLMSRWGPAWDVRATSVTGLARRVQDDLLRSQPASTDLRILHGDLRLSNAVFATDGRLRALLDWELVTLGDPRVDLGFMLLNWCEAGEEPVFADETVTRAAGIMTRDELVSGYARASGSTPNRMPYFHALAAWRLASQLLFLTHREAQAAERGDNTDLLRSITLLIERAHDLLRQDEQERPADVH